MLLVLQPGAGLTTVLCRRGSLLRSSKKVDVELARGTRSKNQAGGGGMSDDGCLVPARTTQHSILKNTAAIVQYIVLSSS